MTHLQQKAPARLLNDVRNEARPTAQKMLWSFSEAGDEMYLEIEWIEDGEYRFDKYLSSNVDMRCVHLVESFAAEQLKSA
jgi:hypothetical protein